MSLDSSTMNVAQSLFGNATDLLKSSAGGATGAQDPLVATFMNATTGVADPMKSAFELVCRAITELIEEVNQIPR